MKEIAVYGQTINSLYTPFYVNAMTTLTITIIGNRQTSICCYSFIIIPSQFHFSITCLFLSLPSLSLLLTLLSSSSHFSVLAPNPSLFPIFSLPTLLFSTYSHSFIFPHPSCTSVFLLLFHVSFVSHSSTIAFFSTPAQFFLTLPLLLC